MTVKSQEFSVSLNRYSALKANVLIFDIKEEEKKGRRKINGTLWGQRYTLIRVNI